MELSYLGGWGWGAHMTHDWRQARCLVMAAAVRREAEAFPDWAAVHWPATTAHGRREAAAQRAWRAEGTHSAALAVLAVCSGEDTDTQRRSARGVVPAARAWRCGSALGVQRCRVSSLTVIRPQAKVAREAASGDALARTPFRVLQAPLPVSGGSVRPCPAGLRRAVPPPCVADCPARAPSQLAHKVHHNPPVIHPPSIPITTVLWPNPRPRCHCYTPQSLPARPRRC